MNIWFFVKKGTKNIEQTQQIADAEAIINYLTLSTSILVFTLLEDNYNTHPKNLKSKSTASEGCAPTFIAPRSLTVLGGTAWILRSTSCTK